MDSPAKRSLNFLRETGHHAQVVERWNQFAKVRQDLFGWIDVVAVDPKKPGILGVQTTTTAHQAERLQKGRGNGALIAWLLSGGRLAVHGWRKNTSNRWVVTVHEVTMADLVEEVANANQA